jgi:hypothetical protein
MTAYRASEISKVNYKTVKKYFNEFADQLCQEENHEDWFTREKRVRQQALEGYSKQIKQIQDDIIKYRKILTVKIEEDDDTGIDQYERIVRLQTSVLIDLTERFNELQLALPSEVLLDKEMEIRMAAKMGMKPKHEGSG